MILVPILFHYATLTSSWYFRNVRVRDFVIQDFVIRKLFFDISIFEPQSYNPTLGMMSSSEPVGSQTIFALDKFFEYLKKKLD